MRLTITADYTGAPDDRKVILERSGFATITISPEKPSVEVDLPESDVLRLFAGGLVVEPEPEPEAPAEE
jgi:hypothetical protein